MAFNFDDLLSSAATLFDKAAAKTGEAIDYTKTKLDGAQTKSKIKEQYCRLGKVCYEMYESGDDKTGEIKKIIAEIKALASELDSKDAVIRKSKVCIFCGSENSTANDYCTKCGGKL